MATSHDFANWVCGERLDPEFLMYALIRSRAYLRDLASGATHKTIYMPTLERFQICAPELKRQSAIANSLRRALAEAQCAASAVNEQIKELSALSNAIVSDSIGKATGVPTRLGDLLDEVKSGVGAGWASHPVLGATREGLAPAKEPPGKQASKYKPATPGTIFYNPMRILIGSMAYVDKDAAPGITSPDYVVIRGKPGVVDSRLFYYWFYYWLRSSHGARGSRITARKAGPYFCSLTAPTP
jgi:type I restriction enzyme S subunit